MGTEHRGADEDSAGRRRFATECPEWSLQARRFIGRAVRPLSLGLHELEEGTCGARRSCAVAVCPRDSCLEAADVGPRAVANDAAVFRAAGCDLVAPVGLQEVPAAFLKTGSFNGRPGFLELAGSALREDDAEGPS